MKDFNELHRRIDNLSVNSWDEGAKQSILTAVVRMKPEIETNLKHATTVEELEMWKGHGRNLSREKANLEIELCTAIDSIDALRERIQELGNEVAF